MEYPNSLFLSLSLQEMEKMVNTYFIFTLWAESLLNKGHYIYL